MLQRKTKQGRALKWGREVMMLNQMFREGLITWNRKSEGEGMSLADIWGNSTKKRKQHEVALCLACLGTSKEGSQWNE